MSRKTSIVEPILATPAVAGGRVTAAIRASLLSSLFEHQGSLITSGIAVGFVSVVALMRLREPWTIFWLLSVTVVCGARLALAHAYIASNRRATTHPLRPATLYAPLALLASALLGVGSMACLMSGDSALSALSIMVTAGTLGGVASRSAGVPRLAITQIWMSAVPVGLGALLAPTRGYWVLVPPIFLAYIPAMTSIVRRHYSGVIALMTAEQKNAELAARFDAALTHMPQGLCTIDPEGKVVIANPRTAELFGATAEMLRLNVSLPEFIGHVALERFGETLRKRLVERCTAWLSESHGRLDLTLSDGRELEMTRNRVPDGSSVILIEDITERRRNEARIFHLATHDSLTGLSNRRDLCDRVERILSLRRVAEGEGKLAMMYLDLDGFKPVNDRLGHPVGDQLLKAVGQRLKETLRQEELVARLGGDEFAVVVQKATVASSSALARRILRTLSEPHALPRGVIATVGVSIGIALAGTGDSLESLMRRADAALYDAKAAGRGTFRIDCSNEGTVG